ncbi:hypothetical protein YWIDRAFT_07069 [Streptomyces sp. SceaMP-e96]|nr:hypothetical protein YWIDRAFT_07069 [Streptomyces sp. SceaMP-e96]
MINIANNLASREIQIHADNARNGDVLTTRADPRRAQSVLGWQPTVDLPTGMRAQMQALAHPAYRTAA